MLSRNLADARKEKIIRLHKNLNPSPQFKNVFSSSYYRALYILCSNITLSILAVSWFLKLSAVMTISVMVGLDIPILLIYFHVSFFAAILSGFICVIVSGLFYPIVSRSFVISSMITFPITFYSIYKIDMFLIDIFNIQYPLLAFIQATLVTIVLAFIFMCVFLAHGRWLDPTSIIYSTNASYRRLKTFAKTILHIKAEGHYVRLITDDSERFVRQSFSKVIGLMDSNDGMKIHRSHWVSYRAIEDIQKTDRKFFVKLCNSTCVPVSANSVNALKEEMRKYTFKQNVHISI